MFTTEKLMRAFPSILLIAVTLTARAQDRAFESGPTRTHLIELFTSQGCSSCPPAEAWLSKLKNEPGLWKNFVPLAFHVDYWDRLGWRDPFASKEWTARQYRYSASWNNDSVYTPGFVLDGRELRTPRIPAPSGEQPGVLKFTLFFNRLTAEFFPFDGKIKDVDLHVATLGFRLNTKITAGENNGRDLRQDFVVLSLTDEKMSAGKVIIPFTAAPNVGAIVAWITATDELEPIQATGGWIY
jgi:hypothetical protein